jgi:fumarylacetoacetate (FAA) hydrolase
VRLVTYSVHGRSLVGELEDGRVHELEAATILEWLNGRGRDRSGASNAVEDVSLRAPVPEPPSVRDFMAYEGHVAAAARLRDAQVPEHWYKAPAFYFSNPASIVGPGQTVRRPEGTEMLDFELEIAAVIGGDGKIAGFTLMNDWSARDIQRREMTVGLGPAKGKDFATSLGPWLVTPDELPYDGEWLHVQAAVAVNDQEVTRVDTEPMHYSWPELVARAARDTRLRAGDVIGSGTVTGGCLLELGPINGHWIEPGDVVTLSADGLGQLRTPVVAPPSARGTR